MATIKITRNGQTVETITVYGEAQLENMLASKRSRYSTARIAVDGEVVQQETTTPVAKPVSNYRPSHRSERSAFGSSECEDCGRPSYGYQFCRNCRNNL